MSLIIRSSGIHAAGCYTAGHIAKDTRVVEYEGERLPVEKGDERYGGRAITYLFGLEDKHHVIDGYGMAMYINHSCQPNCEAVEEEGRIWIVALRDIASGEELSYDYNLYEGDGNAPCSCGASQCRGTMYAPRPKRKRKRKAVAQGRRAGPAGKPRRRAA